MHQVSMTLGGDSNTPPDQLTYTNDGKLMVNGKLCTGNLTTADGTKISFNGSKVTVTTAAGDTMSMYLTDCHPPAINLEGSVASSRPQGEIEGLVGDFDDSVTKNQYVEGSGQITGTPGTSYFMSWMAKLVAQDESQQRQLDRQTRQNNVSNRISSTEAAALQSAGPGTGTTSPMPPGGNSMGAGTGTTR